MVAQVVMVTNLCTARATLILVERSGLEHVLVVVPRHECEDPQQLRINEVISGHFVSHF